MLTEEQKREFENVFNFYSFQREYESEFRAEWDNKMWAFDTAVSILGYKFEPNCRVKSDGIECTEYNLVRSWMWVAFIDKNQRGRASYS